MGKPIGQHPFPFTTTKNPKRDPKIGLASLISTLCCAPSLASCHGTKNNQIWPSILQNLVKGQQAPNTHPWLIPSYSSLIHSASNSSSLAWATSNSCNATTSCIVNSWITVPLSSPSRHCSIVMTNYSSSSPCLSSSADSWHSFSWIGWIRWETSITLLCSICTYCSVVRCSMNLFILSTMVKVFIWSCSVSTWCFTS